MDKIDLLRMTIMQRIAYVKVLIADYEELMEKYTYHRQIYEADIECLTEENEFLNSLLEIIDG